MMLPTCLDFISRQKPERLRWVLTLFAALVATQICYIQHGWINNDTVLYIESARLFADGQWKNGFKVFPWPLYSLLIAGVHQATMLSLHLSAQLMSVVFFAATTYFLIRLIILAGGDNVAVAAGALILFSSHYVVGDVMEMLMRDQGFWAFFLASLMFFIRFIHSHSWKDALWWQACIILATLFRIEGITYLIVLPLFLLLDRIGPCKARLRWVLKAQILPVFGALLLIVAFQVNQHLQIQDLGRLKEIVTWDLLDQLTAQFWQRSQIMADQVLGNFLDKFATQGLLLTLAFVILSKTITSTGIINVGLALYSTAHKKASENPQALLVLTAAMLIALINAQLIILKVFVLSSRYIIPLILIVMIFSALGLARLVGEGSTAQSRSKRMLAWAILIILTLSLIKNLLPKQDGYNYQQEAITWLAKQNVSHDAVYYHDARLRHYAGAPFIGTWQNSWERLENEIATDKIKNYKFLIINIDPQDKQRMENLKLELIGFKEVCRFYGGKKKKYVLVYENKTRLR